MGLFAGEDSNVKWSWEHPLARQSGQDLMAKLMLGGQGRACRAGRHVAGLVPGV